MRSDIKAMLSGFDSRMKFINIVRAMLDYTMKSKISEMIPDKSILDNIIVMVLVFIKEQTLGNERTCTIKDIAHFLDQTVPIFYHDDKIDTEELARFIVINVLQNEGIPMECDVFDPGSESIIKQRIRLLEESKGDYHLTDDAFDFLFRSKEIESELDYSVTRFRMQEYMKRDNYTQALDQSRELISRIRNIKTSMDDFLIRCREHLSSVTEDSYDNVIFRIRSLLNDEEQQLEDIRKNASLRVEKLDAALQSGVDPDTIRKHRAALSEIIRNINITIEEQRELINKRFSFQDEFEQILQDHYVMQHFERMHFKEDILYPLQYMEKGLDEATLFLLLPLIKPSFASKMSIEQFYGNMSISSDDTGDEGIEIADDDAESVNIVQIRNHRFSEIFRLLFEYIKAGHNSFYISNFISSLENDILFSLCEDNSLPNVFLSLYEIGVIDIEKWKGSDEPVYEPLGEFEASWCLNELNADLLDMKKIQVSKQIRTFKFTLEQGNIQRNLDMTDFHVEVLR